MQAPRRDEESRTRWKPVHEAMESAAAEDQPSAFCKALEFLLERVNAMRIDAANARLRLIAPVINTHGIDYERGKFADKLANGSFTLERTEASLPSLAVVRDKQQGWLSGTHAHEQQGWLSGTHAHEQQGWLSGTHAHEQQGWMARAMSREVSSSPGLLQALIDNHGPAFLHVHTAGMLALVADEMSEEDFPETLSFDAHRLGLLRAEFRYICLASTMLVTVSYTISHRAPQVLSTVSGLFAAGAPRELDADKAVSDVCRVCEDAGVPMESVKELRRALAQCITPFDAVHLLMCAPSLHFSVLCVGITLCVYIACVFVDWRTRPGSSGSVRPRCGSRWTPRSGRRTCS